MTTVRRAEALFLEFADNRVRVTNILEHRTALLSYSALRLLMGLNRPVAMGELRQRIAAVAGVAEHADRLVETGVLLECGSAADQRDTRWARSWSFGTAAAALQFHYRGSGVPDWSRRSSFLQRQAHDGLPPFTIDAGGDQPDVRLPAPVTDRCDFVDALARRRTCRSYTREPISLDALSYLAYAVAGRTGQLHDPIIGPHPLTTSPSGGACNPLEAYVIASRVEGLPPGVYRYDGACNGLFMLATPMPSVTQLAGHQRWMGDTAVTLLLMGWLGRTAAKYPRPRAYPLALIEAGHRAQNALLVATTLGLGACVTTEIDVKIAAQATGLDPIDHPPIYLVAIGVPGESTP